MNTNEFLKQDFVKEEIRKRLSYDPITGDITWKPRGGSRPNKYSGKIASRIYTSKNGYNSKRIGFEFLKRKVNLSAARVAWMLYYGDWPKHTIDHINRDSLDNCISNLRDVTLECNNQNRRAYKSNKSGFKGVTAKAGKFWARISYKGTTYRLGYFDTPEEAARAYDKKAEELHGDAAVLNFPKSRENEAKLSA